MSFERHGRARSLTRSRGEEMAVPRVLVIGLVLGIFTAPRVLEARTWRVERDGSGDYTTIQAAVDVAASGDTVRIGPGRFNEGRIVTTPGWTEFVRVLVTQQELALIGSGEETIIGQEELWDLEQGRHRGVVASEWFGNECILIKDITFENMGRGIYATDGTVEVQGCQFEHNYHSIVSYDGLSLSIEDCRFEDVERDGFHVVVIDQQDVTIRGCMFILWDYHQWSQWHVNLTGLQNGIIENCKFNEGLTGLTVGMGGVVTLRDCSFNGQRNTGVAVGPNARVTLDHCTIRDARFASECFSSTSEMIARNCEIVDVGECSVQASAVGSISIQDSDVAHGERGAVWVGNCSASPAGHLDFTNNYWGTDDPDSIQAWIHDRNDSDDVCWFVDYEPYRTESTPVQVKSLGGFKSLFK